MRSTILATLSMVVVINVAIGFVLPWVWWGLVLTCLLLLVALYDANQAKHAILRNFPLIGRVRWGVEGLRPYIQQYIIETDTGGSPISVSYTHLTLPTSDLV